MSPTLPYELEYDIVMFAFQDEEDSHSLTNLLLVSKRIHDWLIPKIYEVVVFRSNRIYPSNGSVDILQKYGHHTHHLIISSAAAFLQAVLPYCPNIKNLALWASSWSKTLGIESQNRLTCLTLTRLSIHIGEFPNLDDEEGDDESTKFDENISKFQIKDNIKRFLSTITHLDVCTKVEEESQISSLAYCLSLTHLCVFETFPPELLRWVFDTCKGLEVLILLITRPMRGSPVGVVSDPVLRRPLEDSAHLKEDEVDRVVLMRVQGYGEDWEKGAKGEEDMWVSAERGVKEMKANRTGVSSVVDSFEGRQD